jgi:hypothetical protein
MYRQCDEFLKLALQGTTTLIASGDYGVAGFAGDITDSGCLSGYNLTEKIYNPDAVSACPYVSTLLCAHRDEFLTFFLGDLYRRYAIAAQPDD